MIRWTAVKQEEDKYDKLIGYTVTVRNETNLVTKLGVSSDISSVTVHDLAPNVSYRISVVGRSDENEGIPSEWHSFKTSSESIRFEHNLDVRWNENS